MYSSFEDVIRSCYAHGATAEEIKVEVERIIAKISAETAARIYRIPS